ncbi:MAG: hypothetical protein EB144_02375 [Actinobacteria bacterium]|nr:hypothetical protein [Actinomycetota bacterium]NCW83483.1 hypothetical protein [Acidimicrobiia bacterium]HBQ52488.1 hypothetical protein [Acidimicrobium sp.]NBP41446.1 hypothetical protein [Actinomycetota bacterium]NBY61346.1 hypothetical protein [Actinomycetota bacterium]
MASTLLNLISTVLFFAVGFALLRWINRFEPQWVSRDGTRFSARMTEDNVDASKWVDVRVTIDEKQLIIQARGRRGKSFRGRWNVGYFTETQDLKRRHYVVTNELDRDDRAILRVPANSTCIASLDAMIR